MTRLLAAPVGVMVLLVGSVVAAPAIRPKPLGPYERVVRPGLMVYCPLYGDRVKIVEVAYVDRYGRTVWVYEVKGLYGSYTMYAHTHTVAEWLRDCPENRGKE